jgi:hypothetical protein
MRNHPLSDLDADIRDHIEPETQKNIERGMSPEDARYAALRKFGNVTLAREDTRAVWIPAHRCIVRGCRRKSASSQSLHVSRRQLLCSVDISQGSRDIVVDRVRWLNPSRCQGQSAGRP